MKNSKTKTSTKRYVKVTKINLINSFNKSTAPVKKKTQIKAKKSEKVIKLTSLKPKISKKLKTDSSPPKPVRKTVPNSANFKRK